MDLVLSTKVRPIFLQNTFKCGGEDSTRYLRRSRTSTERLLTPILTRTLLRIPTNTKEEASSFENQLRKTLCREHKRSVGEIITFYLNIVVILIKEKTGNRSTFYEASQRLLFRRRAGGSKEAVFAGSGNSKQKPNQDRTALLSEFSPSYRGTTTQRPVRVHVSNDYEEEQAEDLAPQVDDDTNLEEADLGCVV